MGMIAEDYRKVQMNEPVVQKTAETKDNGRQKSKGENE